MELETSNYLKQTIYRDLLKHLVQYFCSVQVWSQSTLCPQTTLCRHLKIQSGGDLRSDRALCSFGSWWSLSVLYTEAERTTITLSGSSRRLTKDKQRKKTMTDRENKNGCLTLSLLLNCWLLRALDPVKCKELCCHLLESWHDWSLITKQTCYIIAYLLCYSLRCWFHFRFGKSIFLQCQWLKNHNGMHDVYMWLSVKTMVNVEDTVYYKFHSNNGSNEKDVISYKQQFLQFLLQLFSIFQFTVLVHSHHTLPSLQQKAVFIRQKLTVHSP